MDMRPMTEDEQRKWWAGYGNALGNAKPVTTNAAGQARIVYDEAVTLSPNQFDAVLKWLNVRRP